MTWVWQRFVTREKSSEAASTQAEDTREVTGAQTHQRGCCSDRPLGLEITAADRRWNQCLQFGEGADGNAERWHEGGMLSSH